MTTSIWEKQTFFAPADVLIIGAGFAGLWTALHLQRQNPKRSIKIIDRAAVPLGASTRNAGFSCFGSLTELLSDEQAMGTDQMLQLVNMRYQGMQMIEKYFGKKQIALQYNGGYELFTDRDNYVASDLEQQADYMNHILQPVLKHKKTFSLLKNPVQFGFAGIRQVVKNKLEGQLHPGKLLQSLMQELLTKKVRILTGLEATAISPHKGKLQIFTKQQVDLQAGKVIVCNNGLAGDLVPGISTSPNRGQVLVTSPIDLLPWKGTFHYDEGYYYFRNLGNRVLLGGARNKAFDEENTFSLDTSETIQNELEHFLREIILPGKSYTIDHRWSGTMGRGQNKIPDVRQTGNNIFCALNLGGIGVASAPVIGKELAALAG